MSHLSNMPAGLAEPKHGEPIRYPAVKAAKYLRDFLHRRSGTGRTAPASFPWACDVTVGRDALIITTIDVREARCFIALHGDWLGNRLTAVETSF